MGESTAKLVGVVSFLFSNKLIRPGCLTDDFFRRNEKLLVLFYGSSRRRITNCVFQTRYEKNKSMNMTDEKKIFLVNIFHTQEM